MALLLGGVVFPAMLVAGVLALLAREPLVATLLGLISFS